MTLDELFGILDCYVEEHYWGITSTPWTWQNYKYQGTTASTTDPQINKVTAKIDYGTNSTFYGDSDLQLEGSH